VIIPALNAASTLNAALASVAGQTRQPQAVVVMDDGSEDATAEIATAWKARLPVEVIRGDQRSGIGTARRRAIACSELPMLTLLDADDVWLPDHLEAMFRTYARRPGLITADAHRWVPGLGIEASTYRHLCPIPPVHRQRLTLLDHNFVFIGTLFSRDDYLRAGGFRSSSLTADWDLWIRMSRVGVPIVGVDHPTVLYRVHAGGSFALSRLVAEQQQTAELAMEEALDAGERQVANRTIERLKAARHLLASYEAVRSGSPGRARHYARRAVIPHARTAFKALAMMTAPEAFMGLRDLLSTPTDRWIQTSQRASEPMRRSHALDH
jgi:GT2 family glycosyltransferase